MDHISPAGNNVVAVSVAANSPIPPRQVQPLSGAKRKDGHTNAAAGDVQPEKRVCTERAVPAVGTQAPGSSSLRPPAAAAARKSVPVSEVKLTAATSAKTSTKQKEEPTAVAKPTAAAAKPTAAAVKPTTAAVKPTAAAATPTAAAAKSATATIKQATATTKHVAAALKPAAVAAKPAAVPFNPQPAADKTKPAAAAAKSAVIASKPATAVAPPRSGVAASVTSVSAQHLPAAAAVDADTVPAHTDYMAVPADVSKGGEHGFRGYTHQLLKSVWMWLTLKDETSLLTVENAEDWEVYRMRVEDLKMPLTCFTQEKDHSSDPKAARVTLTGGDGFHYLSKCLETLRSKKYPPGTLFRYHLCTTAAASTHRLGSADVVTLADWEKMQLLQGKYFARAVATDAGLETDKEYLADRELFMSKLVQLNQHSGQNPTCKAPSA